MEVQIITSVLDRMRAFLKRPSLGLYHEALERLHTATEGLVAAGALGRHKDSVAAVPPPGKAEMLLRILGKVFIFVVDDLALFNTSLLGAEGKAEQTTEAGYAA